MFGQREGKEARVLVPTLLFSHTSLRVQAGRQAGSAAGAGSNSGLVSPAGH